MKIGDKVLVTTNNWFYAPNGTQCHAVWGTVKSIPDAEIFWGLKTNRNSTNWYLEIGDMIIAGCQIYYIIKTDRPNFGEVDDFEPTTDGVTFQKAPFSRIYNADGESESS
jgi:hypothetical protein